MRAYLTNVQVYEGWLAQHKWSLHYTLDGVPLFCLEVAKNLPGSGSWVGMGQTYEEALRNVYTNAHPEKKEPPRPNCMACNGSGVDQSTIDADGGNPDGDKCQVCGGSGLQKPAPKPDEQVIDGTSCPMPNCQGAFENNRCMACKRDYRTACDDSKRLRGAPTGHCPHDLTTISTDENGKVKCRVCGARVAPRPAPAPCPHLSHTYIHGVKTCADCGFALDVDDRTKVNPLTGVPDLPPRPPCTHPHLRDDGVSLTCLDCGHVLGSSGKVLDVPSNPDPCRVGHLVGGNGMCVYCGKNFGEEPRNIIPVIDPQQDYVFRFMEALKEPKVQQALKDFVQHAINTGHIRTM